MSLNLNKYLLFMFLTAASCYSKTDKTKNSAYYYSYFPANIGKTLIYNSSFGESRSNFKENGEFITSSNEGEKFKYIQTLTVSEEGVFVKETYQFVKIFLFLKKEADFNYSRPLLRIPFPLTPGKEWRSEGEEYCGDDTTHVIISGRVIAKETVKTAAGSFETVKVETVIENSSSSAKNTVTEWYAENVGLVKAEIVIGGGGIMGMARDLLGYGRIDFELKEILNN